MSSTFCKLTQGSCLQTPSCFIKRNCVSSKRSSCNVEGVFYWRYRSQLLVRRRQWDQHVLRSVKADRSFFSRKEEPGEVVEEEIPKGVLIWRAMKLPMYSVALVPLTVGGAAAYLQTGLFSSRCYFTLLASSVLIIMWLNLSNDVYDFDTGADKNKKESVINLFGSRTGTFIAACLCLALGFTGLTWSAMKAGNIQSILFLTCAIICGYIYQCPPFRLSYQGLGEPLCFAAFGPFSTTAFYLLLGSESVMNHLPLTGTVLSASVLVGFTTALILFCSHFHQVEGDREVGKFSPLVRLGSRRGAQFLCALTLPMGNFVVRFVQDNHKDKEKIFMAKYFCVRLHALFGVALAFGLVLARMVGRIYIPRPIFPKVL
ncbi:2-carboxy-1,4-naphthoquinone phytyltransferase, chloroplastic isoform X2 [Prosopis cineraria]|uniref:2-carboxy-1,4-naphthoquinone phytyltransferase, chloroplastic isoform X2 n=1 Tax=Prosopis cineraria TaxID=364024 RepID=UPI0024101287|nr:2-carboxy-1,4-naphthoquinone phytyltransferase, chloroplastic isoform X2 [Prosopis cineraria]